MPPRKSKHATPAQIATAFALYMTGGLNVEQISHTAGVSITALRSRMAREGWSSKRLQLPVNAKSCHNDRADAWVNRMLADAERAMLRVESYPIPTDPDAENTREKLVALLDTRARRSLGLDRDGQNININLGAIKTMQVVRAEDVVTKLVEEGKAV